MLYTYPDYYKKFSCIADKCEDTCCAGWEIMIDLPSLKKYQKTPGPLGNRLANSINWKEGSFLQYDGRCAFLNEENLCDLYLEGGKDYFCKTCRTYPRHIEEFEDVREVSLAISCPEACRIVLDRKEPVSFRTFEREAEEESYDFFDYLLYSKLCDLRTCMIGILQDRSLPIRLRISMVLALAHDADGHIRRKESYAVDDLISRYTRKGAAERFSRRLEKTLTEDTTVRIRSSCSGPSGEILKVTPEEPGDADYLSVLKKLEVLRPAWTEFTDSLIEKFRRNADEENISSDPISNRTSEHKTGRRHLSLTDIQLEQLMVYWIFTYFVGAVYDENVLAKAHLAAYSTILADRMIRTEPSIDPESDQAMIIQIVHSYSREIEHSDLNLETLEKEFTTNPIFRLEHMLRWVSQRDGSSGSTCHGSATGTVLPARFFE